MARLLLRIQTLKTISWQYHLVEQTSDLVSFGSYSTEDLPVGFPAVKGILQLARGGWDQRGCH